MSLWRIELSWISGGESSIKEQQEQGSVEEGFCAQVYGCILVSRGSVE
jgi:hypothetical protein